MNESQPLINYTPFIDLLTDIIIKSDLEVLEFYDTKSHYQWICSNHKNSFLTLSFEKATPGSLIITPFFVFEEQRVYLRPQKGIGSETELLGWAKENLIQMVSISDAFLSVIHNFPAIAVDSGITTVIDYPTISDRSQGIEFVWKISDIINQHTVTMFFKVRLTNRTMILKSRFEGDEWFTLKTTSSYDLVAKSIENKIRSTIARLTPDVKFYKNILKEPGYYGENVVAFPPLYTKINFN